MIHLWDIYKLQIGHLVLQSVNSKQLICFCVEKLCSKKNSLSKQSNHDPHCHEKGSFSHDTLQAITATIKSTSSLSGWDTECSPLKRSLGNQETESHFPCGISFQASVSLMHPHHHHHLPFSFTELQLQENNSVLGFFILEVGSQKPTGLIGKERWFPIQII